MPSCLLLASEPQTDLGRGVRRQAPQSARNPDNFLERKPMYDQDREELSEVRLSPLEAKALLNLLRQTTFENPHHKRVAADIGEQLMRQGVR